MGFRTVVMLSNDVTHEWENDADLGKRIARAMNFANNPDRQGKEYSRIGNYGRVVECVHGDCQTIAVLDGYTSFQPLGTKSWTRNESTDEVALKLLKEAAEKLGYRLVRKPAKIASPTPDQEG